MKTQPPFCLQGMHHAWITWKLTHGRHGNRKSIYCHGNRMRLDYPLISKSFSPQLREINHKVLRYLHFWRFHIFTSSNYFKIKYSLFPLKELLAFFPNRKYHDVIVCCTKLTLHVERLKDSPDKWIAFIFSIDYILSILIYFYSFVFCYVAKYHWSA